MGHRARGSLITVRLSSLLVVAKTPVLTASRGSGERPLAGGGGAPEVQLRGGDEARSARRRGTACRIPNGAMMTRVVQLLVGLWLFGASVAFLVRADLGLDPWDVLHHGISRRTGVSIGIVVVAVSIVVLALWVPLRQRPGLGTLANVVLVGLSLDATLAVLPAPQDMSSRVGFLVAGIIGNAVATGMYIGAGLGPGPRDGLMTGWAARGTSIRAVRTGVEAGVLVVGWLLGGTVGIGTLAYAVAIGPLAHVFIPLFGTPTRRSSTHETRHHHRQHPARPHRPDDRAVVRRPGAT